MFIYLILSQRLTAFALRVLGQVSKYVDQEQNSICNSLLWLVENCQLENGSFKENSDYQPIKLQVRKPNAQMSNSFIYKFELCSHPFYKNEKERGEYMQSCKKLLLCTKNLKGLLILLFRQFSIGQMSEILDIWCNRH